MFDEDRSGAIDEDEFYFALEYLGLKISDQKQEKFFNKYDKDNSGTIDYEEFMAIWLEVCAADCGPSHCPPSRRRAYLTSRWVLLPARPATCGKSSSTEVSKSPSG